MSSNANSEFLSAAELAELTDYKQRDKQVAVLTDNGIPFRLMGGRPIVSRAQVRDWIAGVQLRKPVGPRLDLVK
jgi:hypothetical protein